MGHGDVVSCLMDRKRKNKDASVLVRETRDWKECRESL